MLFKYILIFSCGGHFIQQSRMICVILEEGIIINICKLWNHFEFGPVVQLEMSFKVFLIYSSGAILFSRAVFVQLW